VGIKFVKSGCTLLDCALGGGYAIGRITNIVGDKSTAKTALATEALINFMQQYPKGVAAYRETEAAYDKAYAAEMGLNIAKVDFGDETEPLTTVEGFARDFDKFLDGTKGQPAIYILDSLDALSDETEMEQDIGKGSYGMQKAKTLSIMFRKMARKIERSQCLLIVVSQVRDNIGAMFGEKHRRSGGRALDFYASQILWLAHIKQLKRTISKVERPYGITIKASVKKNKVGLPLRTAEFDFLFGFGVDDLSASAEWLNEVGRLKEAGITNLKDYLKSMETATDADYAEDLADLSQTVKTMWAEIETDFIPRRSKYPRM
jgi:recombination protein RecA